ncbi:MAG: low specificity L-threonine aldolase [Cyclobacteriaceae bacterium]|nr:MAG: low specificity L-threonine aldolase [Cyclobacteriaceae bacterium]
MKAFASDNYSGVHPEIMEALHQTNHEHMGSYGADEITARVVKKFKTLFGDDTEVFFVYNGTGANVLGLTAATQSFNAIICSELAHINVDESTAPEKFTGCKLIGLPTTNGKIYADQVENRIQRLGDQHHPQAKVISISQSTEYSTVYTAEEVKSLSEIAKKYNFYLHMDGARISNAAVSLGQDFRNFTKDAGVDVLSFGGTKNGMMFGEAVVFFNPAVAKQFAYIRKQGMQLHSKMRFITAQFDALLSNDLWKRSASHANSMAKRLEHALRQIPQIKVTQAVDGNGVFAIIPKEITEALQQEFFFYVWNDRTNECRLMCSFDTTEKEVDQFAEKAKALCSAL